MFIHRKWLNVLTFRKNILPPSSWWLNSPKWMLKCYRIRNVLVLGRLRRLEDGGDSSSETSEHLTAMLYRNQSEEYNFVSNRRDYVKMTINTFCCQHIRHCCVSSVNSSFESSAFSRMTRGTVRVLTCTSRCTYSQNCFSRVSVGYLNCSLNR